MKYDQINIGDIIIIIGLVFSMVFSIYQGLTDLSLNLASGLIGYLGAKHTSKQDDVVDKHDKDVV